MRSEVIPCVYADGEYLLHEEVAREDSVRHSKILQGVHKPLTLPLAVLVLTRCLGR